jgi:hypothetical protein
MEVNQTVINLTRRACQRVTLDADASPALLGAATMLAHELNGLQAKVSLIPWYDFRTALRTTITNQLPPEPSHDSSEKYKSELQVIALLSKAGYNVDRKRGSGGTQQRGTGSGTPLWFVFSNCESKEQYPKDC